MALGKFKLALTDFEAVSILYMSQMLLLVFMGE